MGISFFKAKKEQKTCQNGPNRQKIPTSNFILSDIPHQAGADPRVGVVALIPVDTYCRQCRNDARVSQVYSLGSGGKMGGGGPKKNSQPKEEGVGWNLQGLPACDTGMSRPGAAEHNVVLVVKEVGYSVQKVMCLVSILLLLPFIFSQLLFMVCT